ncbi:unnamed protein product [[Candida] boidinii]|nr:unnamed protein product [[Candida] boidinii]
MSVNPLGQLNECFSYPISTFSRSNEKITNYDNNGSIKNANFNGNQPNGSKNADNDEEEEFQSLDEENCCYANETHLKNGSNSLNTNSNNNASSNQDNDSSSSSNLQNKNDDVYNLFKDIGVYKIKTSKILTIQR